MIAMELSPETEILIELLKALPVGGIIELGTMSAAISRDITTCRYLFYAAAKYMEREQNAVFGSVRRVGYKRLQSNEISGLGRTARSRIRGTARRGVRAMAAGVAGANDIEPEEKLRVLAEQSSLAMIEHLARERNLPKMQPTETRAKPVAETARGFLVKIGALTE